MPWAALIPGLIGAGMNIFGGAATGHTTTSTPTLSPELKALQDQLMGRSTDLMNGTGPTAAAGFNAIDQQFAQMPGNVTRQLAGRGFGASGKLGTALYDTANARANTMTAFRGQMAGQGQDLATQLLSMGRGSSVRTPGSPFGDAMMSGGNALNNLAKILAYSNTSKAHTGGGYSETSTPTSGMPTGNWGDWGGEYTGGNG
jgi:hypothetical protein